MPVIRDLLPSRIRSIAESVISASSDKNRGITISAGALPDDSKPGIALNLELSVDQDTLIRLAKESPEISRAIADAFTQGILTTTSTLGTQAAHAAGSITHAVASAAVGAFTGRPDEDKAADGPQDGVLKKSFGLAANAARFGASLLLGKNK